MRGQHGPAHRLEQLQVRLARAQAAERDSRADVVPLKADPVFQPQRDFFESLPQRRLEGSAAVLLQGLLRHEERHDLALGDLDRRKVRDGLRVYESEMKLI